MKIGIDARMMGKRHGGIGRYVFELSKGLLNSQSGHEFWFFYNQDSVESEDLKAIKTLGAEKLIALNIRHYSLKEQLHFAKVLNSHNLDLVHFPNFNYPLLYKKPFVVTIHDMVHHKISGHKKSRLLQFYAYKKVMESAAKNSNAIITVSKASKTDIVKYLKINPEKIRVIYQGANLNTAVSQDYISSIKKRFLIKRPYFLFVGVLERKKNLISLTRGFDKFISSYGLDMDLVVVGRADPHYPDIRHKALDIKASDRLVFCGEVSDMELSALYAGSYAYTSASLYEGFGLPGVEAMRFGLPLAVSNIETFNEIYDNAAVYFDPLNTNDVAEKLHLLAKDTKFHEQLGLKSEERGRLFDWKKCAEETLKVYNSINL